MCDGGTGDWKDPMMDGWPYPLCGGGAPPGGNPDILSGGRCPCTCALNMSNS